jgi:hypothetical protein
MRRFFGSYLLLPVYFGAVVAGLHYWSKSSTPVRAYDVKAANGCDVEIRRTWSGYDMTVGTLDTRGRWVGSRIDAREETNDGVVDEISVDAPAKSTLRILADKKQLSDIAAAVLKK